MIVQTAVPYTTSQLEQLREQFDVYIKTVIDIEKKICVAGMDRHFEGEQMLLQSGSSQHNIWGGGIDVETKEIDFNSFINIRPRDNNSKQEIQSEAVKQAFEQLSKYFFGELWTQRTQP